ncbi:acyl-ACP--UDP-N- acetylglucosamine O-acyltransferase [Cellulomonas biazotea]|uniref:Acyl-[acyl-carrier-protein]--UDP-N-acetylglucosam ine O-acyltransferase n=1 Tax=Cellulomonas biazotea TaxID=1709 RepID=A0A402DU77_9CELL|nr:acyl-ACP--UDP-N- acetylglucosamine O-acyltransferase [Cellulomonas biazotea]GCE77693.1 acyl-[acyl-carrier-protein]--UDP-N-acetylglucosam ine O-acyltransferase [Cellulomonas biazotea]
MNSIHSTAVIGDGVVLGDGNVIGPHAVLCGPLVVGDDNWIGPGVVIGTPPEVRGVEHGEPWDEAPEEAAGVRIGSRNVIREHALIHQGWHEQTVVGDDCFIMNKVYVAHDSRIGDGVTLASTVAMGGHVRIGDRANVGLGAVLHQRRLVGPGAMVGMGAVVTRDVPPFARAFGNPARIHGANAVGMERLGVDAAAVALVQAAYAAGDVPGEDDVPEVLAPHFVWWAKEVAS